jgi:hypothetical protein
MRAIRLLLLLLSTSMCLAAGLAPANVKFMVRGYFIAGSPKEDKSALGGFATSKNLPKRLDRAVREGQISLVALPAETAAFGKNQGFVVILANNTDSTFKFEAQDSRINVVREALDSDGRWKPIEYLPSSWCGNSYHNVYLPSRHYWSFSAPQYTGTFSTRMRFVLKDEMLRLVSNEFAGTINPEQFTIKQGHSPTGIMDPYND